MIDPPDSVWFARHALLPSGPATDVRFEAASGRLVSVQADADPRGAEMLPGVVLPGLANCHSHAFHRALRGRTHGGARRGDFWTWREQMYALAATLDPDRYLALARAGYAEMALAGFTSVGEFHYLHHAPGGTPYAEPNVMAAALIQAASDAGLRLTLLDACYLTAGVDGAPLAGAQLRFGDRDVERWAERFRALCSDTDVTRTRIGAAVHSVRAVPADAIPTVVRAADGLPLHVHLSEQPAENDACRAVHGCTPTRLLADHGALGPRTSAVHATHLTGDDIALLGSSHTTACLCPTTERDLADGIGPARALADAGSPLSLGTDQHAVVDAFEEARGLELDERLASGQRGRFAPGDLLAAATRHDSLGWGDAGRLEPGARADLVAVDLDSARTAGTAPDQIWFAATAADVRTVVVDGRVVVRDGVHMLGDVGRLLGTAIASVWADV